MIDVRREFGNEGETLAASFLEKKGYNGGFRGCREKPVSPDLVQEGSSGCSLAVFPGLWLMSLHSADWTGRDPRAARVPVSFLRYD